MTHRNGISYVAKERFPSLYAEHQDSCGAERSIDLMRKLVQEDVVEHELVNVGFIDRYLELVDALESLTKALFRIYIKGIVRFEVTREHGIKMLFKTRMSSDGTILNVFDIGWVYDGRMDVIEGVLGQSHSTLRQLDSQHYCQYSA